jgi:hypothetical protein
VHYPAAQATRWISRHQHWRRCPGHWLGDAFDASLRGYWGSEDVSAAMATVLEIIDQHRHKIEGIKISLLNANHERQLRAQLPDGVVMYTGDDFNYGDLITGDETGHSHALLGIFDPIAPVGAAQSLPFHSRAAVLHQWT